MNGDIVMSLDFLAAIFTFLYIVKLLVVERGGWWLEERVEKRSLLNQNVRPRPAY